MVVNMIKFELPDPKYKIHASAQLHLLESLALAVKYKAFYPIPHFPIIAFGFQAVLYFSQSI